MARAFPGSDSERALQAERRTLVMRFDSARSFLGEYERNLASGGGVVPTRDSFELREMVIVRLQLAGSDVTLDLDAEVVHLLDSHAGGGEPGVAVEFQMATAALRDALAPLEQAARTRESAEQAEAAALFGNVGTDLSERPELVDIERAKEPAEVELVLDAPVAPAAPVVAEAPVALPELEPEPEPELELDLGDPIPAPPVAPPAAKPRAATPPAKVPPATTPPAPAPAAARPVVRGIVLDTTESTHGLRARNLSPTGALVCTDGVPAPVGEAVRLRLANPGSGGVLEVAGTVVHHFETDGATTAMGVQFDVDPTQREQLEACAVAVQAADQARRMGGIAGPIEQVGLANLLQMLGSCSKIGTLTLSSGAREGKIALEDGLLRYARVGCVSGPKAIARMLAWGEGSFEFLQGIDAAAGEEQPLSLDGALFEAVRQLDELERVDRRRFPPGATFQVDLARADAERVGLEKTEDAVLDLALAGFKVARIADVVPVPDAEVYEALVSLLDGGVIALED